MPDYLEVFAHLRKRREMYIKDSYEALEGFLCGYNVASEWAVFQGFPEWLAMKAGFGENLSWGLLALYLAFPDAEDPQAVVASSREAEAAACDKLLDLIEEFHQHRAAVGLKRIYLDYEAWLRGRRTSEG